MEKQQIKKFLENHAPNKDRSIVIIDFSNVEKWKQSLEWDIGVRELGNLSKSLSGKKFLRRFYYGSDYGPKESSTTLLPWSKSMLEKAQMNNFEVMTKRVKYMPNPNNPRGMEVKCDLDVEMTVDLIRERDSYDTIILFSGDGDMAYALKYLYEEFDKKSMVFACRDFVGREIRDAKDAGIVSNLLFAEDFEYRLSYQRRFTR